MKLDRVALHRALKEDRVHIFTPCDGLVDAQFPYVVYRENPRGYIYCDGWNINARGLVNPEHGGHTPVPPSQTSHIDFAAPALRKDFVERYATENDFDGYSNFDTMDVALSLQTSGEAHAAFGQLIADLKARGQPLNIARATTEASRFVKLKPRMVVFWDEVFDDFLPGLEGDSHQPEKSSAKTGRFHGDSSLSIPRPSESNPRAVATAAEKALQGTRLPADVFEVLKRSRVQDNVLYLPSERLDKALYARVNDVLIAVGGKWVGRKTQGHVFDGDASDSLEQVLTTGRYVRPQDVNFFPTPSHVVDRLMAQAGLQPGMRVLEPEAGRGNLASAAAERVGSKSLLTLCELMPANVKYLQDLGFTDVTCGDFLDVLPVQSFDAIVMNPPFSGGQDIEHFVHASKFLLPHGRITAILSPGWQQYDNAKSQAFRELMVHAEAQISDIEAGAFKSSGTGVSTVLVNVEAAKLPWVHAESSRPRMTG